jgi:hypothetical protein
MIMLILEDVIRKWTRKKFPKAIFNFRSWDKSEFYVDYKNMSMVWSHDNKIEIFQWNGDLINPILDIYNPSLFSKLFKTMKTSMRNIDRLHKLWVNDAYKGKAIYSLAQ